MSGRRRKKDEDNLGLPSYDSSSMTATPGVSVSTNPSPAPSPAPAPARDARAFPTSATAMLGQILSGRGPVGGSAAAPPGHIDVVEELTKASELHGRGALTDAEFAALKKKLLGG